MLRRPASLPVALVLCIPAAAAPLACGAGGTGGREPPAVVVELGPPTAPSAAATPGLAEAPDESEAPAGMIQIPGGRFLMGYAGCDRDEQPEHEVELRGFWLDATEVTVEAYQRCVAERRCEPAGLGSEGSDARQCNAGQRDRAQHPMNCVSWTQADAYCRAQGKRLPTEPEWELAARGPKGRTFPWGDTFDPDRLCWNRREGTCPVGTFPGGKTPEGLADMAGNVWEWTASHYCDYEEPDCSDPTWVDRGGAWVSDEERLVHGAHRGRGAADMATSYIGFRCARDR